MKKCLLLILAVPILAASAFGQDPNTNLEKYWRFKERQKNYVVVGDCPGCSLPTGSRALNNDPQTPINALWHDQTGEQGYYIATLAMEYKLRLDHGLPTVDVDRELFFAIESLNRLDMMAEYWWDYYYNGNTTSPGGNLNGFLIRDDVPANFFNTTANGNLVENQFNHSIFSNPLDYRALGVQSGFTRGPLVAQCEGHTLGPEEMSQDHYIQILAGLAVVVKLLPSSATYGSQNFMDGQANYAQEAKNIAYRILSHARTGNQQYGEWIYTNPITGYPVQGVEWDECIASGWLDIGFKSVGGGSFRWLSYGYAMAVSLILNDFNETAADAYYQNNFANDNHVDNSKNRFLNDWNDDPPNLSENEDYKVLFLSAIGNLWDNNTANELGKRFDVEYQNGDEVHIPQAVLINQLLYGNSAVPNSVWECMLNSASCGELTMADENFEWGHGHGRFLYGPNVPHYLYNDQIAGLPYMYFFNLYSLCNPNYLGSNYTVISPTRLLNSNLVLTSPNPNNPVYHEYDEKKYFASDQVSTQGEFIVTNDNNPAQAYATPLDAANVTFAAGQSVVLSPGFQVTAGAKFHGYIDPMFQSISCEGQNNSATCTNCTIGVGEENPGNNPNDLDGVLIVPTVNNECFVAFENHLFKVDLTHAQGSTMLGIGEAGDCESFPCVAGCPGDRRYSVLGYHNFEEQSIIVGVAFTGTSTFVAFDDGRIIKFAGTGGTGVDIIGVMEGGNGEFQPGSNSYLEGQQDLNKIVDKIEFINKRLFIVMPFRLMKIGPVTLGNGSGMNMFDVTTNASGDFVWGPSSIGDSGDEEFQHMRLTEIGYFSGYLFVCGHDGLFDQGKILKIDGMGETGNNMFHVDHSPANNNDAFGPVSGHQNYAGDQYFVNNGYRCYVTRMIEANGELLLTFRNGAVLKLQGTGGSGHNMFNVDFAGNGFNVADWSHTVYLLGSQVFTPTGVWPTDIDFINGVTYVSCFDGKILKVTGTGGTGYNMFNVDANTGYGFSVSSFQSTVYMLGCSDFRMTVTQLSQVNNQILISLHPGVLLNLNGSGGGNNMFGLAYQHKNSFKAQCGYFYFEGSEDFTDLCENNGNREIVAELNTDTLTNNHLIVYPNPTEGLINIQTQLVSHEPFLLEIFNAMGQRVYVSTYSSSEALIQVDLSIHGAGIYYVRMIQGDIILTDNVIQK